jgi:hypothetical protein
MDDIRKVIRLIPEADSEVELDRGIEFQRAILDEEERDPFVVTFVINSGKEICGFVAKGTTGFVQYGLDIIAAGVSSLSINTAHSIQSFTQDQPEVEISKNYVKCIINKRLSKESKVLLKAFRLGIESIQNTYGKKYVNIEELMIEKNKRIFGLLS